MENERVWLSGKELEKMKEDYSNLIDEYVDYIENYRQYKEAQRRNDYYSKMIKFTNDILTEMEIIIEELRKEEYFKDITELKYSKGYFRIKVNGIYKYRKVQCVKWVG